MDVSERWTIKKADCRRIDVLNRGVGKIPESLLGCKEIQPVHPKGDQSWIFIGRTEAQTPVLWPLDAKSWLIGKDPDAGKDWGQGRRGRQSTRGWMASSTRWTWVWVNSGSWWWPGRRQWHPTPVLLPWKSHGRRSLVGAVHGVAEGRTRLSDFTFTFHFPALEKEMAAHSSVLAWRIPGTGEPGGLRSMGSHSVRHDWSNLAAAAAGRPGVLQSMGLQRVWHPWVTEHHLVIYLCLLLFLVSLSGV